MALFVETFVQILVGDDLGPVGERLTVLAHTLGEQAEIDPGLGALWPQRQALLVAPAAPV